MPPETDLVVEYLQTSSQRETFIAVLVGVAATVWIIKQLWPMVVKKKEPHEDTEKEAMRIITAKDQDNQYMLLSIPRLLRDFTTALVSYQTDMRQLVNHQQETNSRSLEIIGEMHKGVQETLRIVETMREKK